MVGLFIIAGHHSFLYLGQQHVSGSVAAVIVSLSPVLTAVFASALLAGTRVGPADVVGLFLGFAGVFVIADPAAGSLLSADSVGIGLVFLSAASFALGSVLSRPLDTGLPVQSLQGWAMVFGSLTMHGVSLARGESVASVVWTPTAVASLVYLTLVSGILAFLLYFELLERIGPMELNLVSYFETVVATLLGWALLGHLVDSSTVAGFLAIFLGFAVVKRRRLARLLSWRRATA
jgi:drug/metabolite transporter (DMT)-like permease